MNFEQIEWFDPLEKKGNLAQSKIHAKANRPYKIISHITKDVSFCNCCLLPLPKKNIVVPFSFCDSIEEYSQLGLGTFLYFYFIIFVIVISATLLAVFSFSEIYISHSAVKELTKFCTKKTVKYSQLNAKIIKICELLRLISQTTSGYINTITTLYPTIAYSFV